MRNHLLRALSKADAGILLQAANPIRLAAGAALNEPGQPIADIIFVEDGIASVTLEIDGRHVEVAMIGREGALGVPAGLERDVTLCQTFCATAILGLKVSSEALAAAMDARSTIRSVMHRYVHVLMLNVGHGASATALLQVRARLARWLLMASDRTNSDELILTHDEMARALGVRRPGVTVSVHELEGEHAIKSKRGKLIVTDREKLKVLAGSSYGIVEALHAQLIRPHSDHAASAAPPTRSAEAASA